MTSIRPFPLLLCLLLLLPATATRAQVDTAARGQLQRMTQGLQSLQANFRQQVIRTDGVVEDASDGRLWLRQPHFFRWEYGGDFPEVIVADGERIWIHDIELEQVSIRAQSEFASDSPLTLLTDIGQLDEQFEVREAGDIDGMDLLELRPVNPEAQFERVLLGLRNDVLQLMAMEDAFGLRTEIRFADVQRNVAVDDDLFRFTPPPGVDVIGVDEDIAGE